MHTVSRAAIKKPFHPERVPLGSRQPQHHYSNRAGSRAVTSKVGGRGAASSRQTPRKRDDCVKSHKWGNRQTNENWRAQHLRRESQPWLQGVRLWHSGTSPRGAYHAKTPPELPPCEDHISSRLPSQRSPGISVKGYDLVASNCRDEKARIFFMNREQARPRTWGERGPLKGALTTGGITPGKLPVLDAVKT